MLFISHFPYRVSCIFLEHNNHPSDLLESTLLPPPSHQTASPCHWVTVVPESSRRGCEGRLHPTRLPSLYTPIQLFTQATLRRRDMIPSKLAVDSSTLYVGLEAATHAFSHSSVLLLITHLRDVTAAPPSLSHLASNSMLLTHSH